LPRLPLARAHRPRRFTEVLGQEPAVRALAAAASRGEIASAYIFSGTRGIGKTTLARLFAKALNCEQGPAEDCCAACSACEEIAEGRSLDVLELDAATHTGIDDIRELREAAQYPPGRDRYRVFILDEAHQLSTSAWNGLLKILEEPPPWCVFIFCTTEPHKIPPTIESRALHFSFRSPSLAAIRDHLRQIAAVEDLEVAPEALDLLAEAADGSVRDGLSALDQVRALGTTPIDAAAVREALGLIPGEAIGRYVEAVAAGDAAGALDVVRALADEGQDLRAFAGELLRRVRDLAVARALDQEAGTAASVEQLVWMGGVLDETEARLRQGGPQRVLLELATVRLTRMAGLTDLAELVGRLDGGGASGPGGSSRPGPAPGPVRRPPPPRTSGRPATPKAEARPPAPDEPLLPALIEQLGKIRPPVASYLGRASAARFEQGRLTISLPADRAALQARLGSRAAQQALGAAIEQLFGNGPSAIEVEVEGGEEAPAPPPRSSRDEALDQARRHPLVRAVFDQFGAVVIDGKVL
jgi:DNA polymerase-3 subunit gamma/tau